jgi:hypothetical protein
MTDQNNVENRLEVLETQLREILNIVKEPTKDLNLMQLRVAAYRKINSAVEQIDRVLEMIETEFVTDIDPKDLSPSVIFLNQQQEDQHNGDLRDILTAIREIRWTLISPPENYQNEPVAV